MKKIILLFLLIIIFIFPQRINTEEKMSPWWEVQSVDTMKYSRDLSREKLRDLSFNNVINSQIKKIAETGATHVAIGTPYDEEFLPILKRWVEKAREYKLKVWFRSNWSGWEGWFGYKKITRTEHQEKTRQFILDNKDLFEDGDIFTACSECENGGPGDPRITKDIFGFRKFLIDEHVITKKAFISINKKVINNYNSMNGDVAKLIMDKDTTKSLNGIVTIDHYVQTPEILHKDIEDIAKNSGGKIVLGEFGAPIPDIHGNMSEQDQAKWLLNTLNKLSDTNVLIGINYWVGFGGSTKLWNDDETPRSSVKILQAFYKSKKLSGIILDYSKKPIVNAKISTNSRITHSDKDGKFDIQLLTDDQIRISKIGYIDQIIKTRKDKKNIKIILAKSDENLINKLINLLFNINTL